MNDPLIDYLRSCCVQVLGQRPGCGFFIAPQLVVTCSHVVGRNIEVGSTLTLERWVGTKIEPITGASVIANFPQDDIAFIQTLDSNSNFAPLSGAGHIDHRLIALGFPHNDDRKNFDQFTALYEGKTLFIDSHGRAGIETKFKTGQVESGFSGGPLLNLGTSKVIGVVVASRDRRSDLGGWAIEVSTIERLLEENQQVLPAIAPGWITAAAQQSKYLATQLSPLSHDLNHFALPHQRNPFFTGREDIIRQLHKQLTQANTIAITQIQAISGLGGVGKTQTAVEYAYRYHYDQCVYNSVFWVKADTEANIAADFAAIANQLALPTSLVTQAEKIPAVQAWLSNNCNWLLIFDNADTPDFLTSFIPSNPQGKVLVTSRDTIFDQLGIRTHLALDVLSPDEAVTLLFERTGYERTEANVTVATEINEELDGLPLALEQASAFIVRQKIDFSVYLRTYRKKGLSLLEKEKAKTGQYPSSVLKTWTINFEAVAEENPVAIALLEMSAFLAPDKIPYGVLVAGAEHLGNLLSSHLCVDDSDEVALAIGELLALLSQYSLVRWEFESQSYSVHRLIQAVVQDGIEQTEAMAWLDRVAKALSVTCPGIDFAYWEDCAQLLPHWLKMSLQAEQAGYESSSLADLSDQAGSYLFSQGQYGEAEALYKRSLEVTRRVLGKDHPDEPQRLSNLATLYCDQGRYDEAEPLYEKALLLIQTTESNDLVSVAASLNNLAQVYKKQGRYSEAEPLYVQSLFFMVQHWGEEHPNTAKGLNNLAQLYASQGRYNEAEPLYERSLVLRIQAWGEEHPDVAKGLNNLAAFYFTQGRYDEAEPLYERALALAKKIWGEEHQDVAVSLNNLAQLYSSQGRDDEAEPLCKQALSILQQVLHETHPNVMQGMNNLAGFHYHQGRYDEAELLYKRSLLLREQLLGREHPDVAQSLNNLAQTYSMQGRHDEAELLYEQSLAMSRRMLGEEHPDVASRMNNLALLYHIQGRYNEAKQLCEQSLSILERALGEFHPSTQTAQTNLRMLTKQRSNKHVKESNELTKLAQTYSRQGRYSEAKALLEQVLEIERLTLEDVDHPDVAKSLNNLAQLYSDEGRYSEAEQLFKQALEGYKRTNQKDPTLAGCMTNLAQLYEKQKRHNEAELLFKEAIALSENSFEQDNPDLTRTFNDLATLYYHQGRYSESELFYRQSLDLCRKLYGENHRSTQIRKNNLKILRQTKKKESKKQKGFAQYMKKGE